MMGEDLSRLGTTLTSALDAFALGVATALDAIFGGLYDLKPDRVTVVLERTPAPPP